MSKLTDTIVVHTNKDARIAYIKRTIKDYVRIEISSLGGWYGERNDLAPSLALSLLDAGTKARSKTELREYLDTRNIQIRFSSSYDRWSAYGSCFPEDIPLFFRLAKEMLTSARLPEKELEIKIHQRLEELKNDEHDNRAVISRALNNTLFPPDHPRYQESLDEIRAKYKRTKIQDIREWYSRIGMNKPIISIIGDISEKEAIRQAKRFISSMPRGEGRELPVFDRLKPKAHKKFHAALKDKSSIDVRVAHALPLLNDDKDFMPLVVLTQMLGGGFSAHLVATLRERDGLTYGAYAGASAHRKFGGLFVASTMFAPENYERGVATLKKEIEIFLKSAHAKQDIELAKESIINEQLFETLSAPGVLALVQGTLENDRDISYLNTYIERVKAVTLKEVLAASTYIQLDKLTEFSAGTFKK